MGRFGYLLIAIVLVAPASGCPKGNKGGNIAPPAATPQVRFAPTPADVDPDPRLAFKYDRDMRFGLTVLKDEAGNPVNKKLTFSDDGATNDYMVRVDGMDMEYGSPAGAWQQKDVRANNGSQSVWVTRNVKITQLVEIIPSKQPVDIGNGERKRLLDTCLVRYEIENTDSKDHTVGMRIMVDTLIGFNDGVPFAVPTMQGLVNTSKDFAAANEVPDFVQALEVPNLQFPGTVGLMTLKVGGDVEAPSRVSLTHWPNVPLPNWDVPVVHMGNDSAVILYWNADRALKPQQKRLIGYAYGLGRIAGGEGTGKLALTVNGLFLPGSAFTVTAYVQKPGQNQTLSLELPPGMSLVEGKQTEIVPPPLIGAEGRDTSILTWKIQAPNPGKYQIKVRSSTGISQTQVVSIQGE